MNQSKHINVRSRDLGFFTQSPITAQRFDEVDGEQALVWCDHAGAIQETDTVEHPRIDEPDIVYDVELMVCDKCPAWRRVGETAWEDAPEDGVWHE